MTLPKDLELYSQSGPGGLDSLVRQHAPLVKKIALHLMARLPDSVQLDDLLQAGMVGLLEAASKYDPSRGASFETYAGIRIRGAIVDEIRRGDWVPRSVHRNGRRIAEAIRRIEEREGRTAREAEVAAELGMSPAEYAASLSDAAGGRLFSLDEMDTEPAVESGESGPSVELEDQAFRQSLAAAIEQLPERERLVLALYYQEEMNLKEIGAVMGVSESRVSQIHSQAALRLRSRLDAWHD